MTHVLIAVALVALAGGVVVSIALSLRELLRGSVVVECRHLHAGALLLAHHLGMHGSTCERDESEATAPNVVRLVRQAERRRAP